MRLEVHKTSERRDRPPRTLLEVYVFPEKLKPAIEARQGEFESLGEMLRASALALTADQLLELERAGVNLIPLTKDEKTLIEAGIVSVRRRAKPILDLDPKRAEEIPSLARNMIPDYRALVLICRGDRIEKLAVPIRKLELYLTLAPEQFLGAFVEIWSGLLRAGEKSVTVTKASPMIRRWWASAKVLKPLAELLGGA